MISSQCSTSETTSSMSSSSTTRTNNESLMLSPPRENKQRRRLVKTSDQSRRKEPQNSTSSSTSGSSKPKLVLKRKKNQNNAESSTSASSKKLKRSIEDNGDDIAQLLHDDETCKENRRPQNGKTTAASSSSESETCIICLCEMSYPLAKLNHCTHKFCHACIDMWRKKSNTCPVCKARFTSLRVFDSKESSTYKVIPVRKKVFEITPEEMVNGFYRNERDDYDEEEEDETFINDHDEFDGFIDENGDLYLGEAQEDPRFSLQRRGNGDIEPENSEDEEDDDANASDADEHGNLAGFVEVDPNALHTNDDESFVLNDDEEDEEDFELSQVSLVDEHDSSIVATPERARSASPFRRRPNHPPHVIDISSPNENAARKTTARGRIINIEEEENEEDEVIEDDDATEVIDPNEIQEIIEIL